MKIARCEGDDVYRKFMAKVSYSGATHPSPPYYCNGARQDSLRQWDRHWRKLLGKPTSHEIGALTKVLSCLKGPVNDALGHLGPLKYGTIAIPYLPALYNEDLVDAAEYAGFQLITAFKNSGDSEHEPGTDINFSFCGMQLGGCRDSATNTTMGDFDVSRVEDGNVLSVSFTQDMLTAHVSPLGNSASHFYAASGIADPWLGRAAKEFYSSKQDYWTAVGDGLLKAMDSYPWRAAKLSRVVVRGELATDVEFQKILREKITSYQKSKSMPPVSMVEPLYAAALGAAELGKRCMLHDEGRSWGGAPCVPNLRPRMQGW